MSEFIIKAADWAIDYNGDSLFKDAEEIVRCRDCELESNGFCSRLDEWDDEMWFPVEPDGFCAWGEHKVEK